MTTEVGEPSSAQIQFNPDDYYTIRAGYTDRQRFPFDPKEFDADKLLEYAERSIPITKKTVNMFPRKRLLIPKRLMERMKPNMMGVQVGEEKRCSHLIAEGKCDGESPCYWYATPDHPDNKELYDRLEEQKRIYLKVALNCGRVWQGSHRALIGNDGGWLVLVEDEKSITSQTQTGESVASKHKENSLASKDNGEPAASKGKGKAPVSENDPEHNAKPAAPIKDAPPVAKKVPVHPNDGHLLFMSDKMPATSKDQLIAKAKLEGGIEAAAKPSKKGCWPWKRK